MNLREQFEYPEVYSTPSTPFSHRYQTSHQSRVAVVKPSESFYVHCQDAPQEQLPRCVRDYRRKFCARIAKLNQQRVKERRKIILKDRVDCLSERLERVRLVYTDYHQRRNQNWLKTRELMANDMKEHLQRRERKLIERVESLREHNGQVKNRCELLRYGNYLRRIARQHEERRKRKSIF
ncbi:hypothetical protein ACLKA7_012903 [Drosophila subpalustris]